MNIMYFFVVSFIINCKKIIGRKSALFVMCLMPLCVFLSALFFGSGQTLVQVNVGVAFNGEDAASRQVFEHMRLAEGVEITAFTIEGRAEMERLVVKGELECGYVLDSLLSERILADDLEGVVTVVKTKAGLADAIVNEMLYAALIEAASPHITAETLARSMGADYDAAFEAAAGSIEDSKSRDIFVKPKYSYENAGSAEAGGIFRTRALNGVVALFILMSVLFACPMFIDEKMGQAFVTLSFGKLCAYRASVFVSIFLLNACFGTLSVFAMCAGRPAAVPGLPAAVAGLCLYTSAVSMTGVFFICALRNSEPVYGSFVFILLLNLLFGGVLLDLSEISPKLGAVSGLFLSSHYLKGGPASVAALALGLCVSAGLAFLCLIIERNGRAALKR